MQSVRGLVHLLGCRFRLYREDLLRKLDLDFGSRLKVILVLPRQWEWLAGAFIWIKTGSYSVDYSAGGAIAAAVG